MTANPLSRPSAWFIPGLLILLSLVPAAAGVARLAELAGGASMTVANARFISMPLPVTLHLVAVIPYSIRGALQFAPASGDADPGGTAQPGTS